jgi:hypothetical protein
MFFGPLTVIQKVGSVAYKLNLPEGSSVHLMFHVSQLKKAIGAGIQVVPQLPYQFSKYQAPVRIIQRRLVERGVSTVLQVLVKWSDSPDSMATWEDFEALHQKFPSTPALGQTAAYGGGGGMLVLVLCWRERSQK